LADATQPAVRCPRSRRFGEAHAQQADQAMFERRGRDAQIAADVLDRRRARCFLATGGQIALPVAQRLVIVNATVSQCDHLAARTCQIARAGGLALSFCLVDNRRRCSRGEAMRHGWASRAGRYTRNLLILHTKDQQALSDWETVKEKIEARAPDIEVRIDSNDQPNAGIDRWQVTRPSLVFSPFRLLAYRAPAGTVYAGREIGKIAEWQRLVDRHLPVPRTVRLVPELRLRPEVWGEYVIVKPVNGLRGRDVRLMRADEVARRFSELTHNARRRMLVQEFIDNVDEANRPTSYRALTMFGKPLSLRALAWIEPRRSVAEIAADPGGRIASNDEEIPTRDRLVKTPDVLALARRIATAFPEIPCLGQDIVRRAGSGELYILETNPGGAIWHLSSAVYMSHPGHDAEHMRARYAQFDALEVVANQLIARTRAEAL
jgi:hypothetical protein